MTYPGSGADFKDVLRVYATDPRTGRRRVFVEGKTLDEVKKQLHLFTEHEWPADREIVKERTWTTTRIEIVYTLTFEQAGVTPSDAQPQPPTPDVLPDGGSANAWPPSQQMPRWTPKKNKPVDGDGDT